MKSLTILLGGFLAMIISINVYAQKVIVKGPDNKIISTFETDKNGHLSYSVTYKGKTVIEPSPVGIVVDSVDLGKNAKTGLVKTRQINETYVTRGVHTKAVNRCNVAVIPVTGGNQKTQWTLEVRAFNDAVAYRYQIPGEGTRKINGEASAWALTKGSTLWYQSNNARNYEAVYKVVNPDTLRNPLRIMTTSTFKLPENLGYAMITEANLINYTDMGLEVSAGPTFKSIFHNSPRGWQSNGAIESPWRVVILVNNLNELVNTDVLHNLCPAPSKELANASWIKPGRSTWHWMVTGSPKLEDQKKWIDWTKTTEFEYYIIDDGWIRWKKEGLDQWGCMKEVTDYAKTQGVKIWAWVHSKELFTPEQRKDYFTKIKALGIVGLKIDFMKDADPIWVQWYDDCLRDLAKYELMVDFHGAVKPTGRERTWPNELTREGIRGRENGKQSSLHDIALIFTRFVQGHADYTPTDFRPEKLRGSTWSHELAMAVNFTSPMFCFSGRPEDYIASDAFSFLKTIPATWDETKVLPGSAIGEMAVIARRKGNDWYIGVMNNNKTENFKVSLSFLGKGTYNMEKFEDVADKNDAWSHTKTSVTANTVVSLNLSKDGGSVMRISLNKI